MAEHETEAEEIARRAREEPFTIDYGKAAPPTPYPSQPWGVNWGAVPAPTVAPLTWAGPATTETPFNWPATGEGHGEMAHPVMPLPAAPPPPEPVAPGPFGKADRREQPFIFPAPDAYGVTPDFRDPGMLTGVEPGSSVAEAAQPGRYGVIPPAVAQGAVAAVTAPGAAQAGAAPAGDDIAGPDAVAARFKEVEALKAEQKDIEARRQAVLEPARKARERYVEATRKELAEYRTGLEAARPPQPKLQKMPAVPDLKIRPWLDPEGKDAISTIAQTLGMLAVGAAGVHYKTPLTAMKYFREAAENWRRDEIDAASSKFKQFQATVETIKNDNDVELQQYALADKAYAHNVEAKKAMVAARLDDLGLQDQAIKALEQPYDERLKAVQLQSKNILDLQKASTEYLEVVGKLNKGAAKLPTGELGLVGFINEGRRRLADPADPVATDPVARKTLEGQVQTATNSLKDFRQNKVADAETKAGNVATITIGKKKLQDGFKLRDSADYFEKQLEKLLLDYKTAASVPGALPGSNTLFEKWWSEGVRNFKALPPNVQGALESIKTFKNELQVGTARAFLDDRGVQSIKAFGELGNSIMSYPAALAVIRRWENMIKEARYNAQRLVTEGGHLLETPGASAVPAPAPPPEPEPE